MWMLGRGVRNSEYRNQRTRTWNEEQVGACGNRFLNWNKIGPSATASVDEETDAISVGCAVEV